MKHPILVLILFALTLSLVSCKDGDSAVDPANNNTAGIIKIDQGLLVTMGLNYQNQPDTLALTISRAQYISIKVVTYDREMLFNNSGVLDRDDDIWQLQSTGSGTDVYRITRPGTHATMLLWEDSWNTQGSYYRLYATTLATDSTSFHIHPLSNGHFTIESVSLPGYYLNMRHPSQPGMQTEFAQGKPQEFWLIPWE